MSIALSAILWYVAEGPRASRRVLKAKPFDRFARQNDIEDAALCEAVQNAEKGLIDAKLGGGVIKQRVARSGGGKSGGFRTIIFFREQERAVFVHGFAKSDQGNITQQELRAFKAAAKIVLRLSNKQIDAAVEAGVYVELACKE